MAWNKAEAITVWNTRRAKAAVQLDAMREARVGMEELYAICERSGVAGHVSHYNGPADLLLTLIEEGRARGLDLLRCASGQESFVSK
jgi:hypothetical protein